MCVECENCGEDIPMNEGTFTQLRGGESYSQEYGYYTWFEGYLTCPHCEHENDYADQSI